MLQPTQANAQAGVGAQLIRSTQLHDFEKRFEFAFDGARIDSTSTDVPDSSNGFRSLQVTSAPGPNGSGFGYVRPSNLPTDPAHLCTFYVKADPDHTFTLGIRLQDDDNGDGVIDFPNSGDDEFGYDLAVPASGGWQHVVIPYSHFTPTEASDGDGIFNPAAVRSGGNGELVNVVFLFLSVPEGQTVSPLIDDVVFTNGDQVLSTFHDFEERIPFDFDGADIDSTSTEIPDSSNGFHSQQVTSAPGPTGGGYTGGVGHVRWTNLLNDGSQAFSLYVKADPISTFTLGIRLLDDDNGDRATLNPLDGDDEFGFDQVIEAGSGWQHFVIPLSSFMPTSFSNGDATFNPEAVRLSGNGALVAIVFLFLDVPEDQTVSILIDDIAIDALEDPDTPTVIEQVGGAIPEGYSLGQNYPNPFNPTTTIEFALPSASPVTLKVFSLLGAEVATLIADTLPIGNYKIHWDADGLASGTYVYRIRAGSFTKTRTLVLIK